MSDGQKGLVVANFDTHFNSIRRGDNSLIPESDIKTAACSTSSGTSGGASGLSQSSTMYTSPSFYSPIHTPVNWQIPSRRREIYIWILHPNNSFLMEDFTYCSINNFDYAPKSIVEDTLTDGIIYENIECDNILSGHGNWRKPVHVSERNCVNKKFIKIKVSGYYNEVNISEEHNLFCIDRKKLRKSVTSFGDKLCKKGFRGKAPKKKYIQETNWEIKKVRADELKLKDFILTPIPKFTEPKYQELTNDQSWLMGLLIADGSFCKNIQLNCGTDYPFIIDFAKKIMSDNFENVRDVQHSNSEKCRRIWTNDKRSYELYSKFITGKLNNKKLTEEIKYLNKEQILHILGGYFDGDGSFDKNSNNLVANNCSKDMSDQLYFMCLMCDIPCTLTKHKLYGEQHVEYGKRNVDGDYRLLIPSSEIYKLKDYMKSGKIPENFKYENHDRVLRFFTKDEEGNKYFAQPVEKIEQYLYTGKGYDFQIDPERDYLCSGFKVSNCRFFAQSDPKIAASLRFYSQFPFSGFQNVINDPIRAEYFEELRIRLDLDHWLPMIAYEYFTMGDVFPFISFYCEKCRNSGLLDDGNQCMHEGGSVAMLSVLNPDWIDVKMNPLDPSKPVISLIPDDTLKQIVWSKNPPEIYNSLPDHIKKIILSNKPIPLSRRSITHLKHDEIPYQPYGRSLLGSLFTTLAYQDKLKNAQWIVAERHILPVKVAKVGSEQRPASNADIADVQSQLAQTANDPNVTLVTHHAFDLQWQGASGKVLQLSKEWDQVDKALIQGLGVNDALLSGTGPSYASAALGIEATIRRLDIVRNLISKWIEEKIYKEEARMKGFYKENLRGEKILDYPTIKWDDLNLRDETQKNQMYLQLWDKGIVSTQFICEQLGIDYEIETERVRLEQQFQQQFGIASQGRGPGGGKGGLLGKGKGGGGGLGGGFGGGGPKMPGGGDPNKGNLPGGQSGPPLANDSLAPSMGGGESMPMGSLNDRILISQTASPIQHSTAYELAKQFAPSVSPVGKYKIQDRELLDQINEKKYERLNNGQVVEEEPEFYEGPRTGLYRPTNIEGMLYAAIGEAQEQGNLPADFFYQINPEPERMSRITCDGVFPSIRLIIEADGKQFHSSAEDIEKNQGRDAELVSYGWNVLRYTEDEIKFRLPEVLKSIIETAQQLMGKI